MVKNVCLLFMLSMTMSSIVAPHIAYAQASKCPCQFIGNPSSEVFLLQEDAVWHRCEVVPQLSGERTGIEVRITNTHPNAPTPEMIGGYGARILPAFKEGWCNKSKGLPTGNRVTTRIDFGDDVDKYLACKNDLLKLANDTNLALALEGRDTYTNSVSCNLDPVP